MQLSFFEFGVLVYPVFAVRTLQPVKEVYYKHTRVGELSLPDHIVRMEGASTIVPMFINPRTPQGSGWKCVEYIFGKTRIAGYYR